MKTLVMRTPACGRRVRNLLRLLLCCALLPLSGLGCGDGGDAERDAAEDAGLDVTAPTIVSVAPADGELAVLATTSIVITFSEPMNKSFTQSAYQSADIPGGQVVFTWNDAGTELTVDPNDDLNYATGSDPATLMPLGYHYLVTTAAEDEAGNALAGQVDVTFYTLRNVVGHTLRAADHELTGSWRSDNTIGTGACATSSYCVGDSQSAPNAHYMAGFTFDLSAVPAHASFYSATLSANQGSIQGEPYLTLGSLHLEHVSYRVLDAVSAGSLFLITPLPTGNPVGVFSTSATPGVRTTDVLDQVAADWSRQDGLSQFRLRWTVISDFDGVADAVAFTHSSVQLALSYLTP